MSLREYSKLVYNTWKSRLIFKVLRLVSTEDIWRLIIASAAAHLTMLEQEGIIQVTPQYHDMGDALNWLDENRVDVLIRSLDVNRALSDLVLDEKLMELDKE